MNKIGIDIGSTNSKIAVLDENNKLLWTYSSVTGFSGKKAADILLGEAKKNGYSLEDAIITATGYGRVSADFAAKKVTEITCHARGSIYLFDDNNITIIDIGGQDTKIIDVQDGSVKDFIMNDKCSAGTGRFLDVMAKTLEVDTDELINLAKTGSGVKLSSLCTVFAESEIISLIGKSETRENIARGILDSIIEKVANLGNRLITKNKKIVLTGGLSNKEYITKLLSDKLSCTVLGHPLGKYAGAIGAALQ